MSQEEAFRLLKDLGSDSNLKESFKNAGAGGFEDAARNAGYDVSRDDFANAIKGVVASSDLAGDSAFSVGDGVVSGITGGVSSHVSGVGTGII